MELGGRLRAPPHPLALSGLALESPVPWGDSRAGSIPGNPGRLLLPGQRTANCSLFMILSPVWDKIPQALS